MDSRSAASWSLVPANKIKPLGTRYSRLLKWIISSTYYPFRISLQAFYKNAKKEDIWNIIEYLLALYEHDKEMK